MSYSDLEMALEYVSHNSYEDHNAYLCQETGHIFYESDAIDEELPPDLDENDRYILIPSKSNLDLGKPLVLRFVAQHLQPDLDTVYSIFRKEGAYSRYKALLMDRGALALWHEYEQAAQKLALEKWCRDNGIEISSE